MKLTKSAYFGLLAGWFFMIALPLTIYAETSVDINKNPIILIDKQVIERDRRLLISAKAGGEQNIIKAAQQRLQQDIRKMKADKAALKKKNQKNK